MVPALPAHGVHKHGVMSCLFRCLWLDIDSKHSRPGRLQPVRSQAGGMQRHPASSHTTCRSAPHLLLPGSLQGIKYKGCMACRRAVNQPSHMSERAALSASALADKAGVQHAEYNARGSPPTQSICKASVHEMRHTSLSWKPWGQDVQPAHNSCTLFLDGTTQMSRQGNSSDVLT